MKIIRPDPNTIIIVHSRWLCIAQVLSSLFFIGVWYKALFSSASSLNDIGQILLFKIGQSPANWIIILIPTFFVVKDFRAIKVAFRGEVFTFDGARRLFLEGDSAVAKFEEISRVEIKFSHPIYRIYILLKDNKAIHIAQAGDEDSIIKWANEIAGLINVTVTEKKVFSFFTDDC